MTRIMLVTQYDTNDRQAWSGIPYGVATALHAAASEMCVSGPLDEGPSAFPLKSLQLLSRMRLYPRFQRERYRPVLSHYAWQVARDIERWKPQAVLSLSTLPISLLRTDVPIFLWTGSSWASMRSYYPEFRTLSNGAADTADRHEDAALRNCRHIFFASRWAAKEYTRHYGHVPASTSIAPWGSELSSASVDPAARLANVRLLAVGRSWERKGFSTAIEVAHALHIAGISCTLDLVGAPPPKGLPIPHFAKVHGWLDRRNAHDRSLLNSLYSKATLFLALSSAEVYGQVINEAAAAGVPTVANDTGGLGTAVQDYRLGHVAAAHEAPNLVLELIRSWQKNPERYAAACVMAQESFEHQLRWDVVVGSVVRHIDSIVSHPAGEDLYNRSDHEEVAHSPDFRITDGNRRAYGHQEAQ